MRTRHSPISALPNLHSFHWPGSALPGSAYHRTLSPFSWLAFGMQRASRHRQAKLTWTDDSSRRLRVAAEAAKDGGAELAVGDLEAEAEVIEAQIKALREENAKLREQMIFTQEGPKVVPPPGEGKRIFDTDEYLNAHRIHLEYRFGQYKKLRWEIDQHEGGLEKFSRGYEKFGFNRVHNGIVYREWAPGAYSASLIGDFNNWNPNADIMKKDEFGVWELFLPDNPDGTPAIPHGSRVKIHMDTPSGWKDAIPAWIKFAVQAPGEIPYNGIYYDPPPQERHVWKNARPKRPRALRIYEAHVGMSSTEPRVSTYAEFRDNVLPRVRDLGYNAIQLMAIQEHAYYGSFGCPSRPFPPHCSSALLVPRHRIPLSLISSLPLRRPPASARLSLRNPPRRRYHVTNFFAVSSRCGTPDELKSLIDAAHGMGIVVLMDCVHRWVGRTGYGTVDMQEGAGTWVCASARAVMPVRTRITIYSLPVHPTLVGHCLCSHSLALSAPPLFLLNRIHASNNVLDGLNMFDGTDGQYFHSGERGYHWMWDSRLFNYGHWEVVRFLLSNLRWWLEEYKFDGFRFDGVTSMMYTHHGLQMAFTGNYEEYFGFATDVEAMAYLMVANDMMHGLYPDCVTIAEDVSGMPTLCQPVAWGGVGFDYRLQMAIADKWIELLSEQSDEQWQMGDIVHTLTNRRWMEKSIAYAESHDQALVGDKTIAFWLMDKDMYDFMALDGPSTPRVDRGIALHKMIRLITMALGGEGYLNFMGNEFGHPEWIDFPRWDFTTPAGKFIPGNGGSYHLCRRRFDLADATYLRYKGLNDFDQAMQQLEETYKVPKGGGGQRGAKGEGGKRCYVRRGEVLVRVGKEKHKFISSEHQYVSRKDEGDKLIVFERGDLVFVFNLHWQNSYTDYRIGCNKPGKYKVVLDSDEGRFGGYNRIDHNAAFYSNEGWHDGRPHSFQVYAPSRTAVVYGPADYEDPLIEYCEENPDTDECRTYDE
ncbi:unnamed protein product [Closterium sp. NIES-65]|nr:unnamed protein product [Closterium sp. NIES-65]